MALNTKLLLPALLGFSLVTVSAFVVYYVFKREDEAEDKPIRSTKLNMIEVKVPKSIVPALIGRGGSNIKQIEEKTGATIHFKKFSDKEYDVCVLRGRSHATQIAETLIHDFIKQQPLIENDFMEVPGWACGRIIGGSGETINLISHTSGARVKVEGDRGDNGQRQVSLKGTAEQIEAAKKMIAECVESERCRREIEHSRRLPRVPTPPTPQPAQPLADLPAALPDRPNTPGETAKHVKYRREASSSIEVYVSAVSSPSRFWVQFVGPQVTQLDELVSHMTDYYNKKDNRANHALSHVSVGQVVAAVFRHDGRWYRARVNDIRPNEFDHTQQVADVFFLDYGDSEYVATHELCELRADLLRLRFQAMECFLAGVEPARQRNEGGAPRWHPNAIERFEELTQVAKWKPLMSRTCSYKRSAVAGGREREVPGIKLYDVADGNYLDVCEVLIAEGWAVPAACDTPRGALTGGGAAGAPYGDLGHSRVLGMVTSNRASSMPAEPKDKPRTPGPETFRDNPMSKSLASGLENSDKIKSVSNLNLSYSETTPKSNGTSDFLDSEITTNEKQLEVTSKSLNDEKAKMNRIDSHHSNLEALGKI
ncbi:unnamed protein product [Danaus chrysippus]|uniref:(African queen) hypothetical protein n=1 Tax=Danaus chrysippus TaxID=151541 RepID=A0A8J2W080_9NEOP|nr:unnamed protein product [Danaus chrysippus]